MDAGYWWLIAAVLLVLTELVTGGFAAVCFAFGALMAAVAAFAGTSYEWWIGLFSVGSLLALVFARPFMLRYFTRDKDSLATNTSALIGRRVTVSETIDPAAGTGRVKVDGDEWRAVPEGGGVIPAGTVVEILRQDSVILTVK